jgi:hypothetical protein
MEHYEWRSLGKQPLPGEHQGTPGASATCDSGRAASDALLNRQACIGSPKNNNPDTASVQTTTPTKVLCHRLKRQPLKQENQRLHMKWTDDMNKDLMQCYYKVT